MIMIMIIKNDMIMKNGNENENDNKNDNKEW